MARYSPYQDVHKDVYFASFYLYRQWLGKLRGSKTFVMIDSGNSITVSSACLMVLIHWPLQDVAVILNVQLSKSLYRIVAWAFAKLLSGEC